MKAITIIKSALVLAAFLSSSAACAYGKELGDEKETCKKPRFSDFNLTPYLEETKLEVEPEAEMTFKLSHYVDPSQIQLTAKKLPLDFKVESNSSFHKVKAKLPASLNGQFVRINARAVAVLGCDESAGWLLKIADKPGAAKPAEAKPELEKPPAAENNAPAASKPAEAH